MIANENSSRIIKNQIKASDLRQAPLCLMVMCFCCCSQLNFRSSHSLANVTPSDEQTGPSPSELPPIDWPTNEAFKDGREEGELIAEELSDLVGVHVGHSHVIRSTPFTKASRQIPVMRSSIRTGCPMNGLLKIHWLINN